MAKTFVQKTCDASNETDFSDYINSIDCGKSAVKEKKANCKKFLKKAWKSMAICGLFAVVLVSFSIAVSAEQTEGSDAVSTWEQAAWETDYTAAVKKAKEEKKNLLIYFRAEENLPNLVNATEESFVPRGNGRDSGGDGTIRQVAYIAPSQQRPLPLARSCRQFEQSVLAQPDVLTKLEDSVLLCLPADAEMENESGESVRLLDQPMFREMERHPGLAVIDFEHEGKPYYEKLVGILPFLRAKTPTLNQTQAFLNLPPGTLSQRTLIYAVRIHPDRPQSTSGQISEAITKEATGHSQYQARTGQLGHQNFGSRSSRASAAVGGGGASEICAQGWANEGLYEAAIGCVRAWRNSSGHWASMKRSHRYYGYDMVRGRNNTWYATGLFVD